MYRFNANGGQTTATAGGVTTNFGYDYDAQLVSLSRPGNTVSYVYDALGRQVQRTVGGVSTNFFYDGSNVLFESQNGTETGTYTWGNGLVRRNGEWALLDGVGSARQMTDGGQNVTSSSVSMAYGQAIAVSGSTSCGYTFQGSAGYRTDSGDGPAGGSNYTKVGARYYDAEWGRFITRDTDLSQSPYAYCGGDPVNFSDPSGHCGINSNPDDNGDGSGGDGSGDGSGGTGDGSGGTGDGLGGPGGTDPGGSNPGGGTGGGGGAGGAGSASPGKPVVIPIGSGTTLTYTPGSNGTSNLTLGNQNGELKYTFNNRYNLTGVGGFGKIPIGGGFSFTFNGGVSLNSFKTNYGFGAAYSADF